MNNINNMGGILFAEILNTDEIVLFAVHQNQACIRSKEGHDWYPLPTRGVIEAPTVASDDTKDAGITYKHSATIQFPRSALEGNTANELRNKVQTGCVLRCQDTQGHKYIYGTNEYPLLGTLNLIIGKKVTDFTGYELKLAGTSLHPMLSYIEI